MANVTIDPLESKLVEVVTQMQHGVAKIGDVLYNVAPQAVDAVLMVERINGIQEVVAGLICLIATPFLFKTTVKLYKNDVYEGFASVAGVVATIFAGGTAISTLCNVWTYVAIFEPKISIAHKLLTAMTSVNTH